MSKKIKKMYNDGSNYINTTDCRIEVSLTVANSIKNIIDNAKIKMENAKTKALNDFKTSSTELINNFTNETDFNNFKSQIVDLNNIRINYINSNIVNEILDISKSNKLECKVHLNGKEIGGSIKSINLNSKTLTVDHGNGKNNITILISQICVDDTNKQHGGYNTPSTQPAPVPSSNSPDAYGICE